MQNPSHTKKGFGKLNVENENIFKEGCKEPVASNSLNSGGKKVDTQIPESQATSATPGNLLKRPGERNGENNLNNQDSCTSHEKIKSPALQGSFSGCWNSAETASVPKETKYSRANQGRSSKINIYPRGRVRFTC